MKWIPSVGKALTWAEAQGLIKMKMVGAKRSQWSIPEKLLYVFLCSSKTFLWSDTEACGDLVLPQVWLESVGVLIPANRTNSFKAQAVALRICSSEQVKLSKIAVFILNLGLKWSKLLKRFA